MTQKTPKQTKLHDFFKKKSPVTPVIKRAIPETSAKQSVQLPGDYPPTPEIPSEKSLSNRARLSDAFETITPCLKETPIKNRSRNKLVVVDIPISAKLSDSPTTSYSQSTDSLTKPSNPSSNGNTTSHPPTKEVHRLVPSSSPDELLTTQPYHADAGSSNPLKRTSRKLESSSSLESNQGPVRSEFAPAAFIAQAPIDATDTLTDRPQESEAVWEHGESVQNGEPSQSDSAAKSKLKLDSDDESGDDDFLLDFSKTMALKSGKLYLKLM
jgi:hypothetical protein